MHERFDDSATEVVNQLAALLDCDRVSFGLLLRSELKVLSMSGQGTVVSSRHGDVARIAAAMSEALDQRASVVYPLPVGSTPAVTLAHKALAQGEASLLTVPIGTRHEILGAFLLERRRGLFDRKAFDTAKDVAMFVGPLLALKHRAEKGLGHHVSHALTLKRGPFAARRSHALRIAAACVVTLAVVSAFVPVTQRVVADGRVEGRVQQVIAAPVEGFVGAVHVRPGDTVKAGDPLMALDTRELTLERDKWAAELGQLDKQYREALSKDDAAPIMIARAKLASAQSQHQLAQQQLERSSLRAPIDGIVLSGDWTQAVGAPLKRGQELMTIAPAEGWRIVAEVHEQDIAHIREGQQAQAVFAALSTGSATRFTVTRIAPVATQVDGSNVFEVDGTPDAATRDLRPGMRGVVRIESGRQSLAASMWARARGLVRRMAWRVMD